MKKIFHMLLFSLVLTVSSVSLSACKQNVEEVILEQPQQTDEQKKEQEDQTELEGENIEKDQNSYIVTNEAAIMGMAADILETMTLKEKIGHIEDEKTLSKINNAIGVSFGL